MVYPRTFPYQSICIDEDTFLEVQQTPTMQFGECDAQFRTSEQSQMCSILGIEYVDLLHLLIDQG